MTEEQYASIQEKISSISHFINSEEIPNIDLYMDQVTTFMERHLEAFKRSEQDKILTKTMINNYAKCDLLPPPVKKKYNKNHMILLIYIYHLKNILSINDIQTLLEPLIEGYFHSDADMTLSSIYDRIKNASEATLSDTMSDIEQQWKTAGTIFSDISGEERAFLERYAFVSMLSYDIYIRKNIIEQIIDELKQGREEAQPAK